MNENYKKKVAMICALAKDNHVIGNEGKIPWHIPEDFKNFKELTQGCPIIMGRKTWESLPKKPLPKRENIVISSTSRDAYPYHHFNLESAVNEAKNMQNKSKYIWLIGGQRIYEEGLKICDELHLSFVKGNYEGDTYFPKIPTNFVEDENKRKEHEKFTYKVYTNKIKKV